MHARPGLALLCKGDLHERVMFCFSMYDDDGNGMIDPVRLRGVSGRGGGGVGEFHARAQDEMQNIMNQMMRAMKALGMVSAVPSAAALADVSEHIEACFTCSIPLNSHCSCELVCRLPEFVLSSRHNCTRISV